MAAFFFFFGNTVLSQILPDRCRGRRRIWPHPPPPCPCFGAARRSIPGTKMPFFSPQSLHQLLARGICTPPPCRALSAALSPTPDTCAWAGTIVEAPSIPSANRPALPQQKGPSSIKHQLSQGATGGFKKIISKRGLLVLTD